MTRKNLDHPDQAVDTDVPDETVDKRAFNALRRLYEGDPDEVDGQAGDDEPEAPEADTEEGTRSVRSFADLSGFLLPWGYQRALVTMARLRELARFDLMEPEYARRLEAWLLSRLGHTGIGGAVRFVQPDKPGFAPAGKSFHELQEMSGGGRWFMAVDLVCRNGANIHRSPRWDEVPRQGSGHVDIGNYGLHCNVSGEPWHMQSIEIDGYDGWVRAGRPRPRAGFPIVGVEPPPPPPAPPVVPVTPVGPGVRMLQVTNPPMEGIDIAYLQQTLSRQGLALDDDGVYGEETAKAVRTMQGWNKLQQDGVVGPQTWDAVIAYNAAKPTPPEGPQPGERTLRHTSPTMTGPDVLWLQEVLRGQGLAVSIDGVYGRQTVSLVKTMQGWNNLEQDGVVGPKTWEALKRY